MKLLLISNDANIHRELLKTDLFHITVAMNLDQMFENEIVLISDNEIDFNEVVFKCKANAETKKKIIFYMLSNSYSEQMISNIYSISKTQNIIVIPPKLTNYQIIDLVIHNIFPNFKSKQKKVVTFLGTDSKVGTTMIAHSVAQMINKNTDVKVGLLLLDGNLGTNYIYYQGEYGMDRLKIKLFNNILTKEDLLQGCIREKETLYILPGINQLLDVRHYQPYHIERLIEIALEAFHLVIIDAGSNIDSAMVIASINATKKRYLVTTQQESSRKKYERVENQIFKRLQIDPKDFMLIVNKNIEVNSMLSAKKIADLYQMTLATDIPHLEFLGWQAEFDQKTLLHYSAPSYYENINHLSKLIATQNEIPYRNEEKKRGLFKKAIRAIGGYM